MSRVFSTAMIIQTIEIEESTFTRAVYSYGVHINVRGNVVRDINYMNVTVRKSTFSNKMLRI